MSSGNNMNFSYDGTERRVYKKDVVGSTTTEILYLHDGMNAIVERNKTGTPTEYIYGPTGIIAIKTTTSMHYVLKDHLGSTRVMINTTDQPYAITTYDYSAFGTILSTPSSSAYLYTGQEWDQTSGLHNFRARLYDSDLAMFYGADPAGAFASPYGYVNNNPIIQSDPTGELPFLAVVAIYTAVHVGAEAARGDIDSWRDLGISTAEGVAGGTLAAASLGSAGLASANIASVTSSALSSELPGVSVPMGRGGSLTLSPSFAFDGAGGVSFGGNVTASQRVGNFVVGTGVGTSYGSGGAATGWNGWHSNTRVFGGYASKNFTLIGFTGATSAHGRAQNQAYTQNHAGVTIGSNGAYFSYVNDAHAISPTDKGRTAAAELGYRKYHEIVP